MQTLGIDIGSATSKCILLENGREIVSSSLVAAGIGTKGGKAALEQLFAGVGVDEHLVEAIAVTGYGRNTWEGDCLRVSELSCHALGARHLFPQVRTVIDIGGQDSKVIALDEAGRMKNFLMNDKCAAGTGRFLEVMARILQIELDDIASEALQSTQPAAVSSTCTVFAESEVISQLANGVSIPDVAAGICDSVASRAAGLAKRVGVVPAVCMSGGVAKNSAVRAAIGKALDSEILFSPLAQHFGALGAALYAYRKTRKG